MKKFLFETHTLYKKWFTEIDFKKDLSEEDNRRKYIETIQAIQSFIVYFLNNSSSQYDQIEKYIDIIVKQICDYVDYDKKIKKHSKIKWSSEDMNNIYYLYPLERLIYISQFAIDKNYTEISILIATKLYDKILKKVDDNLSIRIDVISHIEKLFIYPIYKHKTDAINHLIDYIINVYTKLIKSAFKEGIPIFSNIRPNNFLFSIIKEMIDARVPILNLLILRKKLVTSHNGNLKPKCMRFR